MYHFFDTILIARYISIAEDRNIEMLLEFIDASEISIPCECLFVGSTMNSNQICTSILESLAELDEK